MNAIAPAKSYVEVTKPKIVFLLVFTSVATMIFASHRTGLPFSLQTFLLATTAITLACAGCDATTSYIDRDIDAVMRRTRNRPIPSGRIRPPEKALALGLFLILGGLALAYSINLISFAWIILGVFDNVVVYSLLLKRRNPLNIILGGVSGGLPVLFGWSAVTGTVELLPVLLAALVVLWIPGHIWSLAIFTKEDYARAKVPMLPLVVDLAKALRCIVSTVVLMVPFSLAVYFAGNLSWLYLLTAFIAGVAILVANTYLFLRPTEAAAHTAFKFSSPYLFVVFLSLIIDNAL